MPEGSFEPTVMFFGLTNSLAEIVEEVLRRLEENDLFVKLEKCVWKVKEV